MTIFIGADHRGFELKNKLIEHIQEKNIRVEDLGAFEYNPEDDHPDFAQKVAKAVLQNPPDFLGIVICGSGDGVAITANRYKGIYCGLGYNEDQVKHIKERDHINILSLPADYIDFDKARRLVDIFLTTKPLQKEKYIRRLKKIDQI
ncbi:RpiB/LacA/LacB family sugar-phosphate isomerase [Candidatus Roizmanbacteria bacterium]|nr:RpiB/LacA/LacB family sugar-phosphate isomerase [Candidatus Roizmanbacteria bacterium]